MWSKFIRRGLRRICVVSANAVIGHYNLVGLLYVGKGSGRERIRLNCIFPVAFPGLPVSGQTLRPAVILKVVLIYSQKLP